MFPRRPPTTGSPRGRARTPGRTPRRRLGPALGLTLGLSLPLSACGTPPDADAGSPPERATPTRAERIEADLRVLAGDAMEGRRAGTEGERRARDWLVAQLERAGVEPAGEDGYLQEVPLVRVTDDRGRSRWRLPDEGVDPESFPETDRMSAWNVLARIPGTDPELAGQWIIVGAHYDHVGIGEAVEGDSIYNGADDDASGTVAALEIARGLLVEPPGRSVLVALFSAEEIGLLGPRWFLRHPTVPVDAIVADLQIEMIGRPDSLAGGPGRGWLTGYERTTMGDRLAAAGSPIVPDPRPEMRFFFRSDNLPFAQAGIPAHTLSSYDLHDDYHAPSDEVDAVDFAHMTALVEAALAMVQDLSRGPAPEWHEGGRPEAPGG